MQIVTRIFIGLVTIWAMVVAQPGYADEPAISTSKGAEGKSRTWGAGQIQINNALADLFYVVDNDIFLCTPIKEPRTQGAVLAALGTEDQTWSVTTVLLSNGTRTVHYPVFADVRTQHGERRVLLPATLKVKIDIKAGDGKINRPSILSVETANGAPFFTAFLRSDNPDTRRAAIEAWQIESDRVLTADGRPKDSR